MADQPKHGDLRVWWMPNIVMSHEPFYVGVTSIEEGEKMMDLLAEYDFYRIEQQHVPQRQNGGGIQKFVERDGGSGWVDVYEPMIRWHHESALDLPEDE